MTNVLETALARLADVPQDKVMEALWDLSKTINGLGVKECINAWTWLEFVSGGTVTPQVALVRQQLLMHIFAVTQEARSYEDFHGNSQDVHRLELIIESMRQRQAS